MSEYVKITATIVLPKGCYLDNDFVAHGPRSAETSPTTHHGSHGGPGHPIPPDQNDHVVLLLPPGYPRESDAAPETAADMRKNMAMVHMVLAAAQAVFDGV